VDGKLERCSVAIDLDDAAAHVLRAVGAPDRLDQR